MQKSKKFTGFVKTETNCDFQVITTEFDNKTCCSYKIPQACLLIAFIFKTKQIQKRKNDEISLRKCKNRQ